MKEKEMVKIAGWISEVIEEALKVKKAMKVNLDQERKKEIRGQIIREIREIKEIREKVKKLCKKFPVKKEY